MLEHFIADAFFFFFLQSDPGRKTAIDSVMMILMIQYMFGKTELDTDCYWTSVAYGDMSLYDDWPMQFR